LIHFAHGPDRAASYLRSETRTSARSCCPPYRIVYRLLDDVVGIATVVHTSREFHLPESAV
jgi:hypothetical protein